MRRGFSLAFLIFSSSLCFSTFVQAAREDNQPSYFPKITENWNAGTLRFRTSLYTKHFNPKPEHNNHQKLINLEYVRRDNWLVGGAYFRNSFHQPTEYLYAGHDWTLYQFTNSSRLRATLTAGLIHGYKGEYRDKIPFNKYGVAPAILPIVGIETGPVFFEAELFGTAGVMLSAGFKYTLDK